MSSTQRNRSAHLGRIVVLVGAGLLLLLLAGVARYRTALAWQFETARAAVLDWRSGRAETVPTPAAQTERPTPAPAATVATSFDDKPRPTRPPPTALPSPTAAPTLAPVPAQASLGGFRFEYQAINNCGPTTLAMALSFWGWEGNQNDIAALIRPVSRDKNVRWDELIYYVQTQAGWLDALFRVGGSVEGVQRLIANGYPVIIATGYTVKQGWVGHYLLLSGYDDETQTFTLQDATGGPDRVVPYADIDTEWQQFNRLYLVVFPLPDREKVLGLLGPEADEAANRQHALDTAQAETERAPENPYAWFNLGSNLNYFDRYAEAAQAFDQARTLGLPWRMMFYQFGPYRAYFNVGRYQDVVDVTTAALDARPDLEENFYWRGWARYRLDDVPGAIDDFREALKVNPNFDDARASLEDLGASP